MDSVEKKAASVDKAVEAALEELGIERDRAEIKVINEGGLFAKAHVLVSVKKSEGEKALEFVKGLLRAMKVDCDATLDESDKIYIRITGNDNGVVIGHRGEALDAIQYLALLVANSGGGGFKKVVIDVENYREKREATLTELAKKLADKAFRTGKSVELEPMNPYERRIIHSVLHDSDKATSKSKGEEPNRFVVISPKKEYDPYAPCDESVYGGTSEKKSFRKEGFGKVKRFGYNKR
ncbi:MAG: RNA-binding cell elongation regulator Jag/EloR [Christensenellales bacterium]